MSVRIGPVWASHSISYNRMRTVWAPYEHLTTSHLTVWRPYDHRVLPFPRSWTQSNTIRIRLYKAVIRSCEIVIRLSANLIRHSCGAMRFYERAQPREIFLNMSKTRGRFLAVYERDMAKDGWTRLNTKRYESVIRCHTVLHDRVRFQKSHTAQLRIQGGGGGFEGFDEPPLAGESLCTTTPPVDNIKTNCFSCPSCIILLFQVPQTLSSYRQ